MAINMRRVGEVADGSVTTIKLADGAVTTNKLGNAAVTPSKAISALSRQAFVGDETEVAVLGTDWVEVKNFKLVKAETPFKDWQKIHLQALCKTSNALYKAYIGLFIDDEVSPRITLETVETDYLTVLVGSADIDDLVDGSFTVKLKLKSEDAGETAYNELLDVFTEI